MRFCYISSLMLLFCSSFSLGASYRPEIKAALNYLASVQVKKQGAYEPGQWPTTVKSIFLPGLLGAGRWGQFYPEATNFTTASIMEVLGGMYLEDPSLPLIPEMMDRAVQSFPVFYQDPLFNFYPLQKKKGVWVRGPRSMYLARYIRGLSHIPSDADTTSLSYLALNYYELLKQQRTEAAFIHKVSPQVFKAFASHRDVQRKPHYYNRHFGYKNTGAFMTWLMDENDPEMPGMMSPPEAGPRIPFGRNDVDCVVNTNVMKLFTWARHTQMPGYQQACDYLKTTIDQRAYGICGIYYPNRFAPILGVAQLQELKAPCLKSHYGKVLYYVLGTQDEDGGWTNTIKSRADRIQSTALALNALTILGDPQNRIHRHVVRKGVKYLLAHAQRGENGSLYWKGQVFFSAVAQARFTVVWRSNAYTTALAAKALLAAEKF